MDGMVCLLVFKIHICENMVLSCHCRKSNNCDNKIPCEVTIEYLSYPDIVGVVVDYVAPGPVGPQSAQVPPFPGPQGRGGAGPPPHRLWPSAIFAAMLALDVNGEGSLDSNWGQGQVQLDWTMQLSAQVRNKLRGKGGSRFSLNRIQSKK